MSSIGLSTECKKVDLVINFPLKERDLSPNFINDFCNKLESYLKSFAVEYFFIVHDRDINQVNGELKTPHIHCLVDMGNIRKRLSTTLNNFATALDISPLCISITKWSSYNDRVQYLIHKNDLEKVQYSISEIHTNCSDLHIVLNAQSKTNISIEYLCFLVQKYENRIDLYNELGLNLAYRYRALINDLYNAKINGELKRFKDSNNL